MSWVSTSVTTSFFSSHISILAAGQWPPLAFSTASISEQKEGRTA
uniref:Uncharacterized protein n=1 Tax=Arundo donax TaxID=35708 RepID=A0A0A9CH10_ARUDO